MKNLMCGAMPILVADDVAHAVLQYAALLAQIEASDIVIVPTVDVIGFASETTVLLAVGVPVAAEAAAWDELEEKNPTFVQELAERTPPR
jgi:hypothetical protein